MAGYCFKPGPSISHLYVVKTDKKGGLQWQKTFGDSTFAYDVMQHGKQYIVCGGTDQTSDHLDDLWIVILDSLGNPSTLNVDTTTKQGVADQSSQGAFELSQNFPNPFIASTILSFSLPKSDHVMLEIFNSLGEKISTLIDRNEAVGSHFIRFSSRELPNGTYFYRLTTTDGSVTKQMIVNH